MNEASTNMDNDEIRTEYERKDLGKGVRGKYYARFAKGTNLVLLDDRVAKAFPTAEDVNAALLGVARFGAEDPRNRPFQRTR